ncbi:MAG: VCBS repeat-containing protein [Chitinophagaceae bacterium]|nr:VCBS repeat-containing protein [Chitinophagaceae bacterium]
MKDIYAQRNAGIFYSTIFAITDPYKRLSGWGIHAEQFFLKDVNGDGKDDAVIYSDKGKWSAAFSDGSCFNNPVAMLSQDFTLGNFKPLMGDVNGDRKQDAVLYDPLTANWLIALSEGTSFNVPVQWSPGGVPGSDKQFLADVNGDGMDDAVIYFDREPDGCWYVGLSNAAGRFNDFVPWVSGFGNKYDEHFLADVNGDGKADAVMMERTTGFWKVAVSDGSCFTDAGVWKTGFGIANDAAFVYDIDRDGKSDIVYYKEADWWVCYSTGTDFDKNYNHLWVAANRPATMVSRSNLPAPQAKMIGNISGNAAGACAVSAGDWLILENRDKSKTVVAYETDTWDAWGNPYTPQLPGFSSKYDAGDEWVNDQQIKLIHDAGFTYIMLDITNGSNIWVDNRAKKLIERIVHWNKNLSGNNRKMFFCISMGSSRTMAHQPASERVELESNRTWDEFYEPYQDAYYQMKGKPLLIHFVEYPANRDSIMQYTGQMPYYQKFTIRWMFNEIKNQPEYVNAYGWPILGKSDNPAGDEVMNVSPGFWNGLTFAHRENGELYRRQWLRVLERIIRQASG